MSAAPTTSLRMKPEDRELIERAAADIDVSFSHYLRRAAASVARRQLDLKQEPDDADD